MSAVTEAQAAQMWCPQVRFQIGPVESHRWQGNAYTNRADDFDAKATTCIGSRCMAWRWQAQKLPDVIQCDKQTATEEPLPRPAHVPASYGFEPFKGGQTKAYYYQPIDEARAGWTGYCGLAGSVTPWS